MLSARVCRVPVHLRVLYCTLYSYNGLEENAYVRLLYGMTVEKLIVRY